ncbi:MAG: integrin alpha [Terricaulis sp.]
MMRGSTHMIAVALAVTACAPDRNEAMAELMPCADVVFEPGFFRANECRIEANGEALHVSYAGTAEGAIAGAVTLELIGERGNVRQVMQEPDVAQYLAPRVHDVDGDGRADILVGRSTGNVNTVSGVWIFNGERGVYARVGEINGVAVTRTEEGYVAVASRSSASTWNVAFSALDASGLKLVASVDVEGVQRADGALMSRCLLSDAPGIAELQLAPADAQAKFCAEPAAVGVLGP